MDVGRTLAPLVVLEGLEAGESSTTGYKLMTEARLVGLEVGLVAVAVVCG